MGYFLRLSCTWEESCESVWPPNSRLYASLTCTDLRLLAGPFDQGLSLLRSCQIMFTVGSLGRVSIDSRPIDISTKSRSMVGQHSDGGRLIERPTIGRQSVVIAPTHLDRILVKFRLYILKFVESGSKKSLIEVKHKNR